MPQVCGIPSPASGGSASNGHDFLSLDTLQCGEITLIGGILWI